MEDRRRKVTVLEKLRTTRDLGASEVASALKMPLRDYLRLERGRRRPGKATRHALFVIFSGYPWEILSSKVPLRRWHTRRGIIPHETRSILASWGDGRWRHVRYQDHLLELEQTLIREVSWTHSRLEADELPPHDPELARIKTGRIDIVDIPPISRPSSPPIMEMQ